MGGEDPPVPRPAPGRAALTTALHPPNGLSRDPSQAAAARRLGRLVLSLRRTDGSRHQQGMRPSQGRPESGPGARPSCFPKNKSVRSRRPSVQRGLDTCPVAQCSPTGTRPACHPPWACHQPPPCPPIPITNAAGVAVAGAASLAAPAPGSESWTPSRGWPAGSSAPWPCRPASPHSRPCAMSCLLSVPAPMQAPRRTRRVLRAPA